MSPRLSALCIIRLKLKSVVLAGDDWGLSSLPRPRLCAPCWLPWEAVASLVLPEVAVWPWKYFLSSAAAPWV